MSNTMDPRYLTHKKGLATCMQDAADVKKALATNLANDENPGHAQYIWKGPCANPVEARKRIEALDAPKLKVSLAGMYHRSPQVKTHASEENVINKKGLK